VKSPDKKDFSYVEVALPLSQFLTFTYAVPPHLRDKAEIGQRVLVPFRNTKLTGVIVGFSEERGLENIKNIEDIPDPEPVFDQSYINIMKQLSDYYITPLGITVYYAMPEGLRWKYDKKKNRWIKPAGDNTVYIPASGDTTSLSEPSRQLFELISERGGATKQEIVQAGFSPVSLKALIKKGLIIPKKLELPPPAETPVSISSGKENPIKSGIYVYHTDLCKDRLKTYIRILSQVINSGKSGVVVFPNIQTIRHIYPVFKKAFGEKLEVYVDGLPEEHKVKSWFRLKNSTGSVLLGTYHSLFIPIKGLSLIVIEDEFSAGYKNQRAPRYDARRLAYLVYKNRGNISLIYGASAPSTETYYLLKTGQGKSLKKGKILKRINPEVQIKKVSPQVSLGKDVFQKIKEDKNSSFLIVANKKGYSSFLYCPRCEDEVRCRRCDIPLKVYSTFLQCEICGKKYRKEKNCPECETALIEVGFGAEKLMEMAKSICPGEVSYLEEKRNRINITTSLAGKGFYTDFYDYVLNVYPDYQLYLPDIKGEENFFRSVVLPYLKTKKGYILLTSQQKEATPIKALLKKDEELFYNTEIERRKKAGLPPFSRLILLTFEKKNLDLETVENLINRWSKQLKKKPDYEGPYWALISKIRDKKRVQVILKNFEEKEKIKTLFHICQKKGIKLIIDVDPKQIR